VCIILTSIEKKILIIHPEGNVMNNPQLHGLVAILCEQGYAVTIASLKRDGVYQQAPSPGSKQMLIDVPSGCLTDGICVLYFARGGDDTAREAVLKRAYERPDLVIGVDRGIIEAAEIARVFGVPFGLISYEIYSESEAGAAFKAPEIEACRGISFAVVPDEVRGALLAEENKFSSERNILIPVSGRGIGPQTKTRYFHEMFGLPPEKKVALFAGSIDTWTMADYLMHSARKWRNDWVLVLHNRYELVGSALAFCERYRKTQNVYFSRKPIDDIGGMSTLINGADAGVALYRSIPGNNGVGDNIKYIGFASGKVATYLQHGLPLIVNETGLLSDTVRAKGLGQVIDGESPFSVEFTDGSLAESRSHCRAFFSEVFDLDVRSVPLLKKIEQVLQCSGGI